MLYTPLSLGPTANWGFFVAHANPHKYHTNCSNWRLVPVVLLVPVVPVVLMVPVTHTHTHPHTRTHSLGHQLVNGEQIVKCGQEIGTHCTYMCQ